MILKKNDICTLNITDCTLSGSGVGHIDSLAVFVPASAVGDELQVHILKVKSNCAFAKIHKIINPSPDRIDSDCPVFPKCGGCAFRHISYEAELRIKENQVRENLRRIGKIDIDVDSIQPSPSVNAYRNKAQYPLSMQGGKLSIGFYAERSHRVIDCRRCQLQSDEFTVILSVFNDWILKNKIFIYDEVKHKGLLRHIYIRKGEKTGEILVCAVINGEKLPHQEELCDALLKKLPQIKSIVLNINKEKTNVILGKKCITLYGREYIEDELCSLRFRISPLSFYQVNALQAERLYNKAKELADPKGKTVLDLYCGTGTIGLTMAKTAKKVIGVEIIPDAVRDAKINAELNGINNAEFICADAGEAAKQLKENGIKPDVIIVDPPRKGCSEDVLQTIADFSPERLVYISCDSATLARDCAILKTLGYTVTAATPFDMFPRTGHVETVALLTK
ncbi:MAG: 23S rRNA (uracil(1939)-C(5))-methyltransferase RlmD [Clostridia bacterium]|nr:23S rRNA (uracil(1939)-C(5))-methyltransferase RlmD [Clostridia bacterium]